MNSTEPLILSTRQFGSDIAHLHTPDCDCACPEGGLKFATAQTQAWQDGPLRQPALHVQALPRAHTLLFNPYYDQGVVVVNAPARAIWTAFDPPRPASELESSDPHLKSVARFVETGMLAPAGADQQPRTGKPGLLSAWIHVTNECNLRCDYCYIRKTGDDMSEETGRAAVDAIFRAAKHNGFSRVKLKFAGGEATLNLPRVFDIHSYAARSAQTLGLEIDTVVLSNGVSIGERAIETFIQRGIRVSISLDGVGETHDTQRRFANGVGSFRWVRKTLDRLATRGVKPFISITLSDRSAAGLADTIRFVVERDLPFNINFFRDNDCATPHADLRLRDDRVIAAMRDAFAVLEANLPERSLLGSLVDRAQFDQPHEKTCGVGDSYLVVDHKGNVAKCQMEIERPVTSVLADDPLAALRADRTGIQNMRVDDKEGCRTCEWKYWCAGGCPALTYRVTGRFDVKSPNCRIYKALYPELLRLEGLRLLKRAGQLAA